MWRGWRKSRSISIRLAGMGPSIKDGISNLCCSLTWHSIAKLNPLSLLLFCWCRRLFCFWRGINCMTRAVWKICISVSTKGRYRCIPSLQSCRSYKNLVYWWKLDVRILGAFAKMRKANFNLAIFVCPSVHLEQLRSHYTDFYFI
jgi:hypothetical protein